MSTSLEKIRSVWALSTCFWKWVEKEWTKATSSYVSLFQIFLCRVLTVTQWVLKHVETKLCCEGVMPRTGGWKEYCGEALPGNLWRAVQKKRFEWFRVKLNRLEWFRLNLRNFAFRKHRSWKNTLQRNWKEMHDFEWFWDFSCSLIVSVSTILMIFEFPMRLGKVSIRFLWGSTQDWICPE